MQPRPSIGGSGSTSSFTTSGGWLWSQQDLARHPSAQNSVARIAARRLPKSLTATVDLCQHVGMRIRASLRPSSDAIAHLEAALRPEQAQPEQIAWIHSSQWHLQLANFGNLVQSDAVRLSEVLKEQVGRLPPPTLRLSGVVPLADEGDDSVWIGIEGDLDAAKRVASSLHGWVFNLGFVLDRRASYKPRIRLGRITEQTTLRGLEQLVERLGSYEGPPWSAESVTLGRGRPDAPIFEDSFEVFKRAYFAGAEDGDNLR